MNNPYKPPSTDQPGVAGSGGPSSPGGPAQCPSCQANDYEPVKFSWWGGLLGPRLFNHVECRGCSTTFNSKTGRSNNTAIAIYLSVAAALGLGLFFALWRGF